MDVELLKENDDGSADYHVNLSNEEQAQLFRFAFIEMLKRGIEEGKKHDPSEFSVDDTASGEPSCAYGPCVKSGKSEQPCYCSETTKIPY
jgi:hypothetical protein